MIYLPPKVIIEKYLRPNGLPESLIHEIPCPRYQGPGEKNPGFEKTVVEMFIRERRPRPLEKKSYGEEEGMKDMEFVTNNELAVVVREICQWLKPKVEAVLPERRAEAETAMLTPEQVAQRLGVHVQTVMKWCRQREKASCPLSAIKIARKWLIPKESVDAVLLKAQVIHGRAG
jgi:excisionase family DNA binding protein